MRLTPRPHDLDSTDSQRAGASRPQAAGRAEAPISHPTLLRALGAARGDQVGRDQRFNPSASFMRSVRRAGFDRQEVAMTIGSGRRSRRWDGCVIVRDRFLGIEVELDPTGTIGIGVRRVG